eukprot:CAMPEP_0197651908 /NCGR_PEP_ID=MMETSP1338-20131121/34126_1 /TAXON_ID=43686 ORGANISM="Pelagodinium beii, Strain RCC1491" /NCGR_SAMPLE_ID=MMETSP1338 /ASSEMBLY_ACC=CAM_ASM_000754 /LENGTH=375 /DNA_ID=CAMNT_0043226669 /DNA_START=42 /DNA_END=1169 /DNA_ORIENTATION=-
MAAQLLFVLRLGLLQLCLADLEASVKDYNETNMTDTTTTFDQVTETTTTTVQSCTLANEDFNFPAYGSCCEGLQPCLEKRPEDNSAYCPPSDPGHEQTCWSYMEVCHPKCPCTPVNEDFYDPLYDHGRCCDGLQKCLEERPESNSVYCPPSDPGHESTCFSHIEMCRADCNGEVTWVVVTGSMNLSVEDASAFIADTKSASAIATSLAQELSVGATGVNVKLSIAEESRRLSERRLQSSQIVLASYTITISAETTAAATALGTALKNSIASWTAEEVQAAINEQLADLGYSVTVLALVSPEVVGAESSGSSSGGDSSNNESSTDTSNGNTGGTSSNGGAGGETFEQDEEDGGSVMQAQVTILTMLLALFTQMAKP